VNRDLLAPPIDSPDAAIEVIRSDKDRDDPVIVALDFESAGAADALVKALGDSAGFYKVGMELFAAAGMDYVRSLVGRGKRVFLDMKYYDIGETVKRAVSVAAKSGATFLTVHAVAQVMRAAIAGRDEGREAGRDAGSGDLKLLAVTVLTSLDEADVRGMGHDCTVSELVAMRVRQAREIGMDGLVASPLEARAIRKLAGPEAILVTPGVRSSGASRGDQKRVATPGEAIRDGADYLVIGRQVTRAADPLAAMAQIRDEIRGEMRVSQRVVTT
jgi:orotidine-5'-phosphate decarboxylase